MVMLLQRFIFCLLLTPLALASITAQVSQSEVYDDESFSLTVSIAPRARLSNSDISALQSLFVIEKQYYSESTQVVNGSQTSVTEYTFQLSPKQTGTLGIPNFHANGEQSQPVFITVLDSRYRKDSLPEDAVLFEAKLSQEETYIDQPVILSLKLALKVSVDKPSINNLENFAFELTQLDSQQYQESINGSLYNVYDISYQFTPDQAGLISLPEIIFSASYPNQSLGRYEKFTRTANTKALLVKNIPANYPANAYWLPLENLTLSDNLPAQLEAQQNEHLTWNIELTAQGMAGTKLPDVLKQIENNLTDDIKLYKNPPKIEGNQRIESAALSFLQAGDFTLPAVKVPWWNTQTDSLEWAEINQRPVQVSAAKVTYTPAVGVNQNTPTNDTVATPNETPSSFWPLLTALFAGLWLVTLVFLLVVMKKKNESAVSGEQTPTETAPANNLQQAYQHYLQQVERLKTQGINAGTCLNAEELQTMRALTEHLFAGKENPPNLALIRKILTKMSKQSNNKVAQQSSFSLLPK